MDRVSPEHRSRIMARIHGRNTQPELLVRRILYKMGYRYRIHYPKLPGRPDLAFPGRRKAVFVHGCFWHQHDGCADAGIPKSNRDFWQKKLAGNIERDQRNVSEIRKLGWNVLILWECQICPGSSALLADFLEDDADKAAQRLHRLDGP